MKKTVLAIFLSACAIVSHAQSIVPRAGLTLSTFKTEGDDEDTELKSKIGFTLGAGFNIPVNEMFSVQPELYFIQKGYSSKETYSDGLGDFTFTETYDDKTTLNYLEVPVLAKVSFGTGTKFFLVAGPSIAFGLGGKSKIDYSYTEMVDGEMVTESGSVDVKVKFGDGGTDEDEDLYVENRMDFGAQFGAGVLIADKVGVDVRYGLGLSSLFKDYDVKNRVFQFTVFMPLSLGK